MPKRIQGIGLLIVPLCSAVTIVAAPGDGLWQTKVPEADRIRVNPNAGNPNAVAAGAKLFQQHCASLAKSSCAKLAHREGDLIAVSDFSAAAIFW